MIECCTTGYPSCLLLLYKNPPVYIDLIMYRFFHAFISLEILSLQRPSTVFLRPFFCASFQRAGYWLFAHSSKASCSACPRRALYVTPSLCEKCQWS